MVRVKICGVIRPGSAAEVVAAGADAVGLNFVPTSPRFVTHEQAVKLLAELGPFAAGVGVFADAHSALAVADLKLRAVQVYDTEPFAPLPLPHILAARIRKPADLDRLAKLADLSRPAAVLIDAYSPHALGGTGERAPWHLLEGWSCGLPLILAGGLTPDNVADAIHQVRPWGVDVASGVESSPRVKDPIKMRDFIAAARDASC